VIDVNALYDPWFQFLHLIRSTDFTEEQLHYFESFQRNSREKLLNACDADSRAIAGVTDTNSTHTFIYDHTPTMNYCNNPDLIYLHGVWSFHHTHETRLKPMWVHCKWIQDQSFLMPALPGFGSIIRDDAKLVPWRARTDARLFWRARSTGVDFQTGWNWRAAHRIRLHVLATGDEGDVDVLEETPRGHGRLQIRRYPRGELNRRYMDAGLVGPLVQCGMKGDFCKKVAEEIQWLGVVPQSRGQDVKYAIDVGETSALCLWVGRIFKIDTNAVADGNGWSQRYGRLLSTGSVVFKSTVFPEWNTPWLIPYYHFVVCLLRP
jgi:hypothetical protein